MILSFFERPCDKYFFLSIFRLFLAVNLLKKIILQLPYIHDIYSNEGYFVHLKSTQQGGIQTFFSENYKLFFGIQLVLIVLWLWGIGRNLILIILFINLEILHKISGVYILNAGDVFLKFILFYMIFCDSYKYFSVQGKWKWINDYWNNFLTNIGLCAMQIHLCMIYFLGGLYKINDELWLNGTATYYISNYERFYTFEYTKQLLLKEYIVKITTYATILYELIFTFWILLGRDRKWLLGIGVLLHLYIYFCMMIHDLSILFIFSYGLFLTDNDLKRLLSKFRILKIKCT